jgi:hypothetical protein
MSGSLASKVPRTSVLNLLNIFISLLIRAGDFGVDEEGDKPTIAAEILLGVKQSTSKK